MLLRHTRAHVLGDASSDPETPTISSSLTGETCNPNLSNDYERCPRTQNFARNSSISTQASSNPGQEESRADVTNHNTVQDLPSSLPAQELPLGAFAVSTGNEASSWAPECGLESTRDIGVEHIPDATALPSDLFQTWLYDFDARLMTVGSVPTFPDLTGETCCIEPEPEVSGQKNNNARLLWPTRTRRPAPMTYTSWQDISSCSKKNLLSQTDQVGVATPLIVHPNGSDSRLEKLRRLAARFLCCGCRNEGPVYTVDDGTSAGDSNMPGLSQSSQTCRTCESASELFRLGLEQYKRRFHATIPILHIPTFCPEDTPSTLLLVMCLLGLTFVNSEEATALVSRAFPVSQPASFLFPYFFLFCGGA